MKFPYSNVVITEDETKRVAKDFSEVLKEGDFVTLDGNLGAGKTFFVKSVCSNWGIENSSSPSFAIVNQYDGDKKVYHFDFYRIKKSAELYDIGFEDYINDFDAVCFIEWSEMFPKMLPKSRYEIKLKLNEDNTRLIEIKKYGR